jgi:Immunity protein Imm6
MVLDIKEFARALKIRARVTFVLSVAGMLLPELVDEGPRYLSALKAYEKALRWQEKLDVAGDELVDFLMNEKDGGMFAYVEARKPKKTDPAWTALAVAVAYVAWHAYRRKKEPVPEGVDDVTEKTVQYLLDEASKAQSFDEHYVKKLYDYLRSNHPIENGDELGKPIDMEKLKQKVGTS